jgi:hypothetical protein
MMFTNCSSQRRSEFCPGLPFCPPVIGVSSNPVQRIMLINEFVIAIVFQKIYPMLNGDGGNQAIHGIPDRYPFASQFAVNRRAQLERRPVILQINQIFKLAFDGDKLFFVANTLQNFSEHKTAAANVVTVLDALFQLFGPGGLSSGEKINPNR